MNNLTDEQIKKACEYQLKLINIMNDYMKNCDEPEEGNFHLVFAPMIGLIANTALSYDDINKRADLIARLFSASSLAIFNFELNTEKRSENSTEH